MPWKSIKKRNIKTFEHGKQLSIWLSAWFCMLLLLFCCLDLGRGALINMTEINHRYQSQPLLISGIDWYDCDTGHPARYRVVTYGSTHLKIRPVPIWPLCKWHYFPQKNSIAPNITCRCELTILNRFQSCPSHRNLTPLKKNTSQVKRMLERAGDDRKNKTKLCCS